MTNLIFTSGQMNILNAQLNEIDRLLSEGFYAAANAINLDMKFDIRKIVQFNNDEYEMEKTVTRMNMYNELSERTLS